jgi:hypothetical protein
MLYKLTWVHHDQLKELEKLGPKMKGIGALMSMSMYARVTLNLDSFSLPVR